MASWTDWCITRIVSNCAASPCARSGRARRRTEPAVCSPEEALGGQGASNASPLPCTPSPLKPAARLRMATENLDEAEHLQHNQKASVASLRSGVRIRLESVFRFDRNQRSASVGMSVHLRLE